MELDYVKTLPTGGFNFDLCIRNKALEESSTLGAGKGHMKTGTTIVGCVWKVSSYSKRRQNTP